jgi:hypothetical protein
MDESKALSPARRIVLSISTSSPNPSPSLPGPVHCLRGMCRCWTRPLTDVAKKIQCAHLCDTPTTSTPSPLPGVVVLLRAGWNLDSPHALTCPPAPLQDRTLYLASACGPVMQRRRERPRSPDAEESRQDLWRAGQCKPMHTDFRHFQVQVPFPLGLAAVGGCPETRA